MSIPDSDEKILSHVFADKGLLSKHLKNYEERTEQKEMSRQILESYREGTIALIEAGTGTGKSFAYLLPALYWALKHQERTVISTHTIALQEQLMEKDIPFLLKVMDRDVKVTLAKGMRNYVCLRKLQEMTDEPLLHSSEENKDARALSLWTEKTAEGSRSDISFSLAPSTWDKVAADGDSCNHVHCPHYKKCFFFKARKEASDAQILIVNHSLLFADIQARRQKKEPILPFFKRLVLDEAHHVEQVALDSSAQRVDRASLIHALAKFFSDTHPEKTRLFVLRTDLMMLSRLSPQLVQHCDTEVPVHARRTFTVIDQTFLILREFLEQINHKEAAGDYRLRLKEIHFTHPFWKERLVPAFVELAEQLKLMQNAFFLLQKELELLKDTSVYSKIVNHLLEVQSLVMRCDSAAQFISQFITGAYDPKRVRWIEGYRSNIALFEAALDVSVFCHEHLFTPLDSAVLCSATLSTSNAFTYTKERLGLEDEDTTEHVYASPFDYATRSLFLVPTDLPFPHEPNYLAQQIFTIERAIEMSQGSAFVLFTSYDMLLNCYKALSTGVLAQKYPMLKQGDLPRHLLLEEFKRREGSILFATDSFWEGVDVPGEALRCVIISKLPFPVPSEPIYEAHAEALEKEGKDPFSNYAIPQAVIKFKQGFGRLLRSKKDRGCILCLDPRIVKKSYGKYFLNSLPPSATCFAPREKVLSEMSSFYSRTNPNFN